MNNGLRLVKSGGLQVGEGHAAKLIGRSLDLGGDLGRISVDVVDGSLCVIMVDRKERAMIPAGDGLASVIWMLLDFMMANAVEIQVDGGGSSQN